MLAARQHRHPIDAPPSAFETTTRRHQSQLGGIYIQFPRVAGRHVAVLLRRTLD
jgi:hypothetical protein